VNFATVARLALLPVAFLIEAWMLVVPIWFGASRLGSFPRSPRLRTIFIEGFIGLGVGVLVCIAMIGSIIALYSLSGGALASRDPFGPMVGSFNRVELIAFAVLALVVAPIAEEVFFRGMLYNALRQHIFPAFAALASALVFALFHPFGPVDSVPIALAGLGCAVVYEWRKTLVAPICVHAGINTLGVTMLLLTLAADAAAPRLGVFVESGTGGACITQVVPESAADRAGLRVGDVLKTVDGQVVTDLPSLSAVVRQRSVGDKIKIEFARGNADQRVEAILTKLKE
jgi:membrane protease YdiL (CAAX protease family)